MAAKRGFRGDAKPLADIIRRAGRVASGELAAKMARRMGEIVFGLNEATARAGTTPTGRRWKPTVDGREPLAHAAGKLGVQYWKGGFKLTLPAPYKYHQVGAYRPNRDQGERLFGRAKAEWRLPARALMPGRGRIIPRRWRAPVIEALNQEWFGAMKG